MKNLDVFRQLLDVMPLHAEEGHIREELAESELLSQIPASRDDPSVVESVVATIRRLFEALALLEPNALAAGRWAFVSFPASLMARSVLETMATPESSFLVSDYWAQGVHRPAEFAEEQRELLYRLENQRTSNREADVRPIRTVHVRWGMIRLGTKFLLHRREDKFRRDVGGYVLPGGRQNLDDLPIVDRKPESLRDLFRIDSVMARSSQEATLERELREELGLTPIDYEAGFLRTLEPFKKVEGTGNNHSFTQYDIAMYSVRLTAQGEMKLLDRVASKSAEWEWFSTSELLAGKLSDGKRAFIDALLRLPSGDLKQFLSKGIPDSSGTPPAYRTKGESIELPSAVSEPLLIGDAGRQKPKPLSLDQQGWELLMLLGWYRRGLPVLPRDGLLISLGDSWVKLCDKELLETAQKLARHLQQSGLALVECDSLGHCRLSIEAEHLYFQPTCFEYYWDFESEEKPIVLTLKGIATRWANLEGREISIRLSPAMLRAMPAIERGHEPAAGPDTIRREFKRLMEPAERMGLRQFIGMRSRAQEILVPAAVPGEGM